MIIVSAVYENGVLRPTAPIDLKEGETVELAVTRGAGPKRDANDWAAGLRSANSIQEWVELANACPEPDPDFDIAAAINESRRLTGFRMPDPEPQSGRPE
jgi:predicted DNA-binding antitoxin AbrB/MazE fold protein